MRKIKQLSYGTLHAYKGEGDGLPHYELLHLFYALLLAFNSYPTISNKGFK